MDVEDAKEPTPDDVHCMPLYGREHVCSVECWCDPKLDYVGPSGAQLWLHREMN